MDLTDPVQVSALASLLTLVLIIIFRIRDKFLSQPKFRAWPKEKTEVVIKFEGSSQGIKYNNTRPFMAKNESLISNTLIKAELKKPDKNLWGEHPAVILTNPMNAARLRHPIVFGPRETKQIDIQFILKVRDEHHNSPPQGVRKLYVNLVDGEHRKWPLKVTYKFPKTFNSTE